MQNSSAFLTYEAIHWLAGAYFFGSSRMSQHITALLCCHYDFQMSTVEFHRCHHLGSSHDRLRITLATSNEYLTADHCSHLKPVSNNLNRLTEIINYFFLFPTGLRGFLGPFGDGLRFSCSAFCAASCANSSSWRCRSSSMILWRNASRGSLNATRAASNDNCHTATKQKVGLHWWQSHWRI